MKNYRNYLTNQAKRREDPMIKQIKKGQVTLRRDDKPVTLKPMLVTVQGNTVVDATRPEAEQGSTIVA